MVCCISKIQKVIKFTQHNYGNCSSSSVSCIIHQLHILTSCCIYENVVLHDCYHNDGRDGKERHI